MTPAIAWRPAWPTSWPQVNRAVEGLRDGVADALGARLVGLYLGGSLALGGFDRGSSDIDVLVATTRMPPAPAIERLAALHAALRAAGGWTTAGSSPSRRRPRGRAGASARPGRS